MKPLRGVVAVGLASLPWMFVGSVLYGDERAGLIVIAPKGWSDALNPFLEHKRRQLPTKLVSLERVVATSAEGVDDPEKVKRFLYRKYVDEGIRYALLVGDVDVFPVRFMVLDRKTKAAFNYAFYASDLYYSDLLKRDGRTFEDWNAKTSGFHADYFGEVRGEHIKDDPINYDQVDYFPELAVGRWPVSTMEQLRTVARKTIAYEQSLTQIAHVVLPRAAFFAVSGWVDSRPTMDFAAKQMKERWETNKYYYSDRSRLAATAPDYSTVVDAFNGGARLIIHAGHGTTTGWEKCLRPADLNRLSNSNRLPVVFSVGCSTAHFAPEPPYTAYTDVYGVHHEGTRGGEVFSSPPPPPAPYQRKFNTGGLGETLLRDNSEGAVAYIGCCTGSQPCGLDLIKGFATALHETESPRLGDVWMQTIAYYQRSQRLDDLTPSEGWYPPSIFFQGMKFFVFGDPTLPMASGTSR